MKKLLEYQLNQKKIAIDTLRMNNAMVGVMGGMTKIEARKFLISIGYSKKKIRALEHKKSNMTLFILLPP